MSEGGRIVGLMKEQIMSNGLGWGVLAIVRLAFGMIRWKVLAYCLHAPGINLGSACHLSGIRFIRFGKDVRARSNLWLEAVTRYHGEDYSPQIIIGDRVMFSHAVHVGAIGSVRIGNDVLFGSNVLVTDHNHGAYAGSAHSSPEEPPALRHLRSLGEVVIEDNVWVGDNVNIVGPVRIGFGAVIGSNSVVRGDVPPRTLVAGVPARVRKTFDHNSTKWLSGERN